MKQILFYFSFISHVRASEIKLKQICFISVLFQFYFTCKSRLRLIGKRVVDFLLALFELFSLGVTAESLRAIIGSESAISLQRGPVDPKFQVEGVVPHQPFFFLEN